MKVTAVITAGGLGTRFGTVRPKQFADLCGKMLIEHTINVFDQHPMIDDIVVVLPETEIDFFEKEHQSFQGKKPLYLATGGMTRQDSVRLGILAVPNKPDFIAIHDAARCLVSGEEISSTIQKCIDGWSGAICALPVKDTLKKIENEKIVSTVSRENLWGMQTPQVFQFELIKDAYEQAHKEKFEATDDAQVAEHHGANLCVVQGKTTNIKVTYPEDLKIAEILLRNKKGSDGV